GGLIMGCGVGAASPRRGGAATSRAAPGSAPVRQNHVPGRGYHPGMGRTRRCHPAIPAPAPAPMRRSATAARAAAALWLCPGLGAQQLEWRPVKYGSHRQIDMVLDAARARLVTVSGARTLEWDFTDWRERPTPHAPESRFDYRLAYDSV